MKTQFWFGSVSCLTTQLTAMIMSGRAAHLNTRFPGKLEHVVNQYFVHILSHVTGNKSKKEGKDQEPIQSSTTPGAEHHIEK